MSLVKAHKGCGWKFKDGGSATILGDKDGQFTVELKIPSEKDSYKLPYLAYELRQYVNSREIISVTFDNWLNEIPMNEF